MRRKITETKGKTALLKLVNTKRKILEVEAAKEVERKNIGCTVRCLVKEGEINVKTVLVRGEGDKLRRMKLLYSKDVKQGEMRDYEKQLQDELFAPISLNNHCTIRNELIPESKIETLNIDDNIIREYAKINNCDRMIRKYEGHSVVTINDISIMHKKVRPFINLRFKNILHKLTRNIDYFEVKRDYKDGRAYDPEYFFYHFAQKKSIVFTSTGYLTLINTFTDSLSQKVKDDMIKSYFKCEEFEIVEDSNAKEKEIVVPENHTIPKQDFTMENIYNFMKMFAQATVDMNQRIIMLESLINQNAAR